jgi:hypothetical protein
MRQYHSAGRPTRTMTRVLRDQFVNPVFRSHLDHLRFY